MSLSWTAEPKLPLWDADKQALVGGEAPGVFDSRYKDLTVGDTVPGEWWKIQDGDEVVGYGWLEVVWGDAEVLLATASAARGKGVGSFALTQLDREAKSRGLNYLYNVVRSTHPQAAHITAWLEKRGFRSSEDGALRRRVGTTPG
jgi:ribosomal protein S18 acetylase RimI-like enzyme